MKSLGSNYQKSVFVNCPFDGKYKRIFDAIIFAVFDCGFVPRCAREAQHISYRLPRIIEIMRQCRYGIHDLSRASIDRKTRLARFNMPLELGIFLGAMEFGAKKQKEKTFMVLDRDRSRYQKFISDLNGVDPKAHGGDPETAITKVRNWLNDLSDVIFIIPSGSIICERYRDFRQALPNLAAEVDLRVRELEYRDYCYLVQEWLKETAP
jgi:hypothetical protein